MGTTTAVGDGDDTDARKKEKKDKKDKKKEKKHKRDKHRADDVAAETAEEGAGVGDAPAVSNPADDQENQPPISSSEPAVKGQPTVPPIRMPVSPKHGQDGPQVIGSGEGPSILRSQQPTAAAQLVITVESMSPVTANVEIVHPLIRAWLFDCATGQPISMRAIDDPSAAAHGIQGATMNVPTSAETFPYDLRMHECRSPIWNEEISLPLPTAEKVEEAFPQAVLLFELVDFGSENIQGETIVRRSLFPIAWGFLKLRDVLGAPNSDTPKILQLFRAPERRGLIRSAWLGIMSCWPTHAAKSNVQYLPENSVPPVYRNFMNPRNRNDLYPATLTVVYRQETATYSLAPTNATAYEQALLRQYHDDTGSTQQVSRSTGNRLKSSKRDKDESVYVDLDYQRRRGERSVPPDTNIHSKVVGYRVTAMTFSQSGKLLAIAMENDFEALIDIRSVFAPMFDIVGCLRGHTDYIHDVNFSSDETLLLSSSADKTVKCWKVAPLPCIVTNSVDEANFLFHTLAHGCHVYAAGFSQGCIVSCGYDKHLWLWSMYDGSLITKVPHSQGLFYRTLKTDSAELKIWALDIRGGLTVWRVMKDDNGHPSDLAMRRRVDCNGATTLAVSNGYAVLTNHIDKILVIVESTTYKVLHRLTGIPAEVGPMTISGDGRLGIAGTTGGRFLAWDLEQGDMVTSKAGVDQVHFACDRILWSPADNIVVCASDFTLGKTTLAVLGRPRNEDSVVLDLDPNAGDAVRLQFGGEIKFAKAGRSKAASSALRGTSRSGGNLRMSQETELPARDHKKRIEQIVRFWTGLVRGGGSSAPTAVPLTQSASAGIGADDPTPLSPLAPGGPPRRRSDASAPHEVI